MTSLAETPHPSSKKIKVLNITEEGRYGGPQSRITKAAVLLKDMGVDTTVICPVFDSDIFVNELKKSGVSHIAMRLHRMTLQLSHLSGFVMGFIPEVLSLRKVLKQQTADVIHCNGCWQLKGMIAARLAKTRAPVAYHLNDTHTRHIIKTVFTFLASKFVDAFIPACERSRDYYIKGTPLADKPSFIIPAPVDTEKFNPDAVSPDIEIEKIPGIKIITVCNINPGKGIEELIDVCELLASDGDAKPISFCVVGPVNKNHSAYFESLKQHLKDRNIQNFYFTGGTQNVAAALKAADIYVCASRFESSPMAVWEAMSMALPIVSNDVGDVKNYLEEGQCGFCVPVGDTVGLKEKISTLIRDGALRQEMGKKSRQFAVKNLDLRICAQKHAAFYRELASLKKGA